MFRRVFAPLLLLAVIALVSPCQEAQAWGWGGCGGPWYTGNFFANGFGASPYSLGQVPVPPYFAIHPPVYYSHPVARPYGYSPYAYPGTVMTPEVAPEVEPSEIVNPYVVPSSASATEPEEKASTEDDVAAAVVVPQWIENPYTRSSASYSQVDLATHQP